MLFWLQILNQPLAPQTLILLNQLLQQIKHLQQAMQQQAMLQVQNPLLGGGKAQISVQIAKAKQSINNLQVGFFLWEYTFWGISKVNKHQPKVNNAQKLVSWVHITLYYV